MKKQSCIAVVALSAVLGLGFTACGDSSSNSDDVTKVSKFDDLSSSCEDGEEALVGEDEILYTCTDGKWKTESTSKPQSSANSAKSSSSTKGDVSEEECDEDLEKCDEGGEDGDNNSSSSKKPSGSKGESSGSSSEVESGSTEKDDEAKIDPSYSGVKAMSEESCGDIWCGPAKESVAKTGFSGTNSNKWTFVTDESESSLATGEKFSSFEWPTANVTENNFGDFIKANYGISGKAKIGNALEFPYVGVELTLAEEGADITDWDGVCISYESSSAFSLQLIPFDAKTVVEYNYHDVYVTKNSTGITSVDFKWEQFKQRTGWGVSAKIEDIVKNAAKLYFKFTSDAEFKILSVGRYGTCGKAGGSSSSASSSASAEEGELDPSFAGTKDMDESKCGDLWCGPKQDRTVKNGTDEYSWFFGTDKTDGGNSYFKFATENVNSKNFSDYIFADYGISGKSVMGNSYGFPYVKLEIVLDDPEATGVDITDWNGLCVAYKSDIPLAVRLVPEGTASFDGYNHYGSTLKKTEGEVVIVDLPWNGTELPFEQEVGWGNVVDLDKVLEKVQAIDFTFENTGNFKLISVGKQGSCGTIE